MGNFFSFYLQPMEVPWARGRTELELLAYITAMATQDPRCICDLHHSLRQHWSLNPLSKAGDRIHILTDTMLGS